jgi:hypothetical protein
MPFAGAEEAPEPSVSVGAILRAMAHPNEYPSEEVGMCSRMSVHQSARERAPAQHEMLLLCGRYAPRGCGVVRRKSQGAARWPRVPSPEPFSEPRVPLRVAQVKDAHFAEIVPGGSAPGHERGGDVDLGAS